MKKLMLIALFSMLLVGSQQAQPKAPESVDPPMEELTCPLSCQDTVEDIWDTYYTTSDGDCTRVCFTVPAGFSNCYTGYIDWGDDSPNTSLISFSSVICHTYEVDVSSIFLEITIDDGIMRCKYGEYIQVAPCAQ